MKIVYFIQAGDGGPIKIGTALNLYARGGRLETLQCANAEELAVLATIEGGRRLEQALHRAHADDLIRGEWFKPSENVLATVAAAIAGEIEPLWFGPHKGERLDPVYDLWESAEAMAADIGELGVTVRQWRNRGSIPTHYWRKVIAAAAERGREVRWTDLMPASLAA